jgi:hypothetical protein
LCHIAIVGDERLTIVAIISIRVAKWGWQDLDSKKTDSRHRVWEIRVSSILTLDRTEKSAEKIKIRMTRLRRIPPRRLAVFTVGSPVDDWASIAVRFSRKHRRWRCMKAVI